MMHRVTRGAPAIIGYLPEHGHTVAWGLWVGGKHIGARCAYYWSRTDTTYQTLSEYKMAWDARIAADRERRARLR